MRTVLQRGLLVGVALAMALGILEGTLRLAAWVLPAHLKRAAVHGRRVPEPGEVSILCVGDSHTYGFGVTPEEAYPAQLEHLLRRRGVRARVINAGIPGMNSSRLLAELPENVAVYRPALVLVWIGANNQWVPDAVAAPRWTDRLRLARLLHLLLNKYEGVSGDFRREIAAASGAPGASRGPGARPTRSSEVTAEITRNDIGPIVDTIRQAGAVPVLLTYPIPLGPLLTAIDQAIVDAGAAQGARVIDLRVMARGHARHAAKLLLPDMHPAPPLYRAIAWQIARTMLRERLIPVAP